MKKNVLIYALKMTVGGVEKALLGQLSHFPADEYNVTLLLQEKVGGFLDFVPAHVNVVEHTEWKRVKSFVQNPLHVSIGEALKVGRLFLAVRLMGVYIQTKIQKSYEPLVNYVMSLLSIYPEYYDLAIDYAGPTTFTASFVVQKVKANEKWTWVHFDIDRFPIDKGVIEHTYPEFDRINVVSTEGKMHFDRQFPELASKTRVFYNIVDKVLVERLGAEGKFPYEGIKAKIIVCTVGRMSKEKGQLMTIFSLKELVDAGYDVHWCYVGVGPYLQKCRDAAVEMGIDRRVTFFGLQVNPYPWMKYCDIYVQPSEHEGFCITLAEAKLFQVPIVSTSFTGASEQLENYRTPHAIVDYDAHHLAQAIKKVLEGTSK